MQSKEYSIQIGGKELTATFSDLTDQAHGSVILKYGNTLVLATSVMSKNAKDNIDFFPLTVDYEEKFYASGQILGSRFIRREGRPSDEAILSGRLVDRTIRPLFNQKIRNEIQVTITLLSVDKDDPDVQAVIAASLALITSNIPWNGPVGAVRICKKKNSDKFEVNPDYEYKNNELELDIVLCGKDGKINMIEAGGAEVSETEIFKAMEIGLIEIKKLEDFQKKIREEIGKIKTNIEIKEISENIKNLFALNIESKMAEYLFSGPGKEKIEELRKEWLKLFAENLPEDNQSLAIEHFENKVNDLLHKEAIENNRRPDGRGFDDVRPLFAKAGGFSKILHGSGIFYRGGTHVFSALTLGGPGDSQIIDSLETKQIKKRFMHHYNFPPFSVGEVGRIGGLNRRMVGHGALAEKALLPVIPNETEFPYTIRIVSESMASNGSTSMASVCASTLALMDAGVPIKSAVAGIASGLMMENDDKYKVLTDIQGPEDHHGDMDFKVAGTKKGVTAIQMDVKISGISVKILGEALEKARLARLKILDVIEGEIKEPRKEISPNAPKILSTKIKPNQIGMIIGTGGKVINDIKDKTGTEIDIEEDGTVFVTGKDKGPEEAIRIINSITKEYIVGEESEGVVTKIADFGAFVDIGSAEGLLHISEIAPFRVEKVSDYIKVGDRLPVTVKEIDDRGRIKLSVKSLNPKFFTKKN